MAEAARNAQRRMALVEPPRVRQGVSIKVLPPETRFSLRLPMSIAAAMDEAAGFRLGMPINRAEIAGARWSARLGPNEWLLAGPESETDAIASDVEKALAGKIYGLTDISHRNVALEAAGADAAAALNAGCPLDLSDKAFPAGSATRTLLGKVEIILMRHRAEPSFRIECWRSFARYAHDFLVEAARDCPRIDR
jgi:sarcosine oxidase subunit gamma